MVLNLFIIQSAVSLDVTQAWDLVRGWDFSTFVIQIRPPLTRLEIWGFLIQVRPK